MSFNVLCSACGDGEYDPWEKRLRAFADIFRRHNSDLIGLQEIAFASEVDEVLRLNPQYEALYYRDGEESYADATIFYRRDRFTVLEQGFFWLSPTPDTPFSTGFSGGMQLARLVAWAKLEDSTTERPLYFATTHFDNNSPSQDKSSPLVLERLAPEAGLPIILTGDFNSQPRDPAYRTLVDGLSEGTAAGFKLQNAFDLNGAHQVLSNQDVVPAFEVEERIDHIFVAGDGDVWQSPEWAVDLFVYGENDLFPSDHFAIAALLQLDEDGL